jgi:hypothetical protein
MSHIVDALLLHIRVTQLPEPVTEYRFAAAHVGMGKGLRARLDAAGLCDWRFDLAYPQYKIAIECEGGTWANGRHSRGKGYENDARKYNRATELGWRVFRFTGDMVASCEAIHTLERVLFMPLEVI